MGGAEAALKSPNVVRVDSEELYRQAVLGAEMPVMAMFYSRYCTVCHKQLPAVDRLADRFAGRAVVAVVNVGASSSLTESEGIGVVPTTVFFDGGERVATMEGLKDERELEEVLEGLCGPVGG